MNAGGQQAHGSTDVAILAALRREPGGFVSGTELAARLGVTRAAISARVRELRARGYDIAASPQLGYRLEAAPDRLVGDDLLAQLGSGVVIGRDIRVFQETASTNDVVERLARDGGREGVVVFAEAQTRGRGRLGRSWVSPAGKGLWFSVLLRPRWLPGEATRLTIMAANAVARAVEAAGVAGVEIKWPNDLLVRGRKVAGILIEMQAELDRIRHVVLGVGVDVNLERCDYPPALRDSATSLKLATGRAMDRPALAVAVLRALEADYRRLREGRFPEVAAEWADRCDTLGREVVLRVGEREVRGRAEGLDESGALLVRTEHGRIEPIVGGEVRLAH